MFLKFNYIWKTILFSIIFLLLSFSSNLKGINLGFIELFPARIIVFGWLIYSIFSGKIREFSNLTSPMLIFFLWGLLLTVINFNIQSLTSLLVYMTSFITMLMYASFVNNEDDISCLCTAILLNLVIQALLGVRESFTGEYLYVTYENYARQFNDFGLNMPKTAFFNVNNYAVYCILCLPFISMCKTTIFKTNIVSFLGYLLGCIAIIFTSSRTGLLCIALYFLLYFYLNIYKRKNNELLKFFILITAFLLVLIFSVYISQFIDLILPSGNVSEEDRLPIWRNYIAVCFNNFLIYGEPGRSTALLKNFVGNDIPPHCMFLEILVEYGIIGLICILYIIKTLKPNRKNNRSIFYRNVSSIFLCIFLICSICPSTMGGCYYLWAMFGIIYSLNNKQILKNNI